ncbi:trehalase-like domain-containing protein [Saccharopolyspora griseoalba]|uniref:Trehalase-like domain-containing protein n=1 Tax=Saccharopolyspora griseoalba TaxID=1431848 RepID=A0ABW2LQV8_9PSEU
MSGAHEFMPQPLAEHAVLADGYRGGVCGPRGDIVWMCAPLWHDDAVFSTLLGGAGAYTVEPVEPFVRGGYYEPRSLIWRHGWVTTSTIVECREALARPARRNEVVLLRRIEAVEREARLRVELDVRAGYGQQPAQDLARCEGGRWTGRCGRLRMLWSGARDASADDTGALRAEVTGPAGEHRDFALQLTTEPVDPALAWQRTASTWEREIPRFDHVVAPGDAQHAHAVLRGMTMPGRGMAAAATMALPERAERGRTTTTATRGYATSATPGSRRHPPGMTRCWTTTR